MGAFDREAPAGAEHHCGQFPADRFRRLALSAARRLGPNRCQLREENAAANLTGCGEPAALTVTASRPRPPVRAKAPAKASIWDASIPGEPIYCFGQHSALSQASGSRHSA